MGTKDSRLDWREGRRRRAWELKQQGWKQSNIAVALGVTPGAVSQWLKRAREQGVEALRRHPAPGRQPRLTPEQVSQLPALLALAPEAYGFRGHVWTCRRVVEVIRRTFGVAYHPAHVSRLLHAVRHRVQRPVARATQRDGGAIQAWWQERCRIPKIGVLNRRYTSQRDGLLSGDAAEAALLQDSVRSSDYIASPAGTNT